MMNNYKDSLDIAQLKLGNYSKEFFWAFVSFIISSFIIYIFVSWSNNQHFVFFDEKYFPLSFQAIKLIFWISIYLFTFSLVKYAFNFFQRGVDYELSLKDWPKNWIYHGGIKIVEKPIGLEIKQSPSGVLLTKYKWKDFVISFEMRFLQDETPFNYRSLGILFRGINLESYFMFELMADKMDNDFYVKPHIRLFGRWEYVDWKKVGNFKVSNFHKIKLWCKDRLVKLYINNLFTYEWLLPDKIDFRGLKQSEPNLDDTGTEKKTSITVLDIPFLNKYGMIGFRADWGQGAIIRQLEIKTLSNHDRNALSILKNKTNLDHKMSSLSATLSVCSFLLRLSHLFPH